MYKCVSVSDIESAFRLQTHEQSKIPVQIGLIVVTAGEVQSFIFPLPCGLNKKLPKHPAV